MSSLSRFVLFSLVCGSSVACSTPAHRDPTSKESSCTTKNGDVIQYTTPPQTILNSADANSVKGKLPDIIDVLNLEYNSSSTYERIRLDVPHERAVLLVKYFLATDACNGLIDASEYKRLSSKAYELLLRGRDEYAATDSISISIPANSTFASTAAAIARLEGHPLIIDCDSLDFPLKEGALTSPSIADMIRTLRDIHDGATTPPAYAVHLTPEGRYEVSCTR